MPDNFRRAWQLWKRVGQAIGNFIARIILSAFYFTIVVPFGLGVRLLSDPLHLKAYGTRSSWLERETRDHTLQDARRQF